MRNDYHFTSLNKLIKYPKCLIKEFKEMENRNSNVSINNKREKRNVYIKNN